jgi:hypothetical protein
MNWKDVGKTVTKTLGKAAPYLGTALGGPAGGVIGTAIANILGVENTPDAVDAAISSNPEAALKLKEFYLKNEQHIRDHAFRVLDAELKDVQNARGMQVEALKQEDKFSKRFLYYLTIYWSVATTFYIAFITFGTIPADNVRFADTCLGFVLGTLIASIFQYFYGSTLSSRSKTGMQDDTINKLIDQMKDRK